MIRRLGLTLCLLVALAPAAGAVNPDEKLADPALEARARALSVNLRCLVCQNQSIDDSNAELAKDLRVLLRERIAAGDTDEQVIDYVVSRYGEFVLLKPRFSARTAFLWGAPVVFLAIGGLIVVFSMRNRNRAANVARLSADEEARIEALLKDRT